MGRTRLAFRQRVASISCLLTLALCLVPGAAAPRTDVHRHAVAAPDWMSAETAAALALGFDILVPSWIPDPFGGQPSVYATGGYYSLYWVVYGGDPTFLEITGEVGGDIPDGSAYDLNVQLTVSAEVQGVPAYRDLTPIYDTVWWQVGSVVYSVSSQNMSGADSLSLANSLTLLVPPDPVSGETGGGEEQPAASAPAVWPPAVVGSGETATVWVEGAGVRLEVDGGFFVATGNAAYADAGGLGVTWQSPVVEGERVVSFVLIDEVTGEQVAIGETVVRGGEPNGDSGQASEPSPLGDSQEGANAIENAASDEREAAGQGDAPVDAALVCPPVVYSGRLAPVRLSGRGAFVVEASHGGWPNEPGNRRFDAAANGGPDLDGTPPGEDRLYLHWRAPQVRSVLRVTINARGPDGESLATCQTAVRPGPPPNAGDVAVDGDGSGGPWPRRLAPIGGASAGTSDGGDGSSGPTGPSTDDGTAGPPFDT